MNWVKWAPGDVEACIAVLRKHRDLSTASIEISATLGRPVTGASLRKAMQVAGMKSPTAYLIGSRKDDVEESVDVDLSELSEPAPWRPVSGPTNYSEIPDSSWPAVNHRPITNAERAYGVNVAERIAGEHAVSTCTDIREFGEAHVHVPTPPKIAPKVEEAHPVDAREKRDEVARLKRQLDQLVVELRQSRARQEFIDDAAAWREPPRILAREYASGIREMTPIVLASDWHIEEPVHPSSVAHRNEYNLDIAAQRVDRFFRAVIWNVEHHRASKRIAIRDLVLWLGGDFFSGFIHPELVESNALSPTEAVRWLLPRLRDGIATLLDQLELEHVEIPCSFGNHGRTTDKPRISTGYANSYEWLMYHALSDEFRRESRVHFEITNSSHQYVDVYGFTLHFHHGDDLKYQGGVGGLGIPLLKAVPSWDLVKKAHVHNIGHFHQFRDYGRAVVNGSLIGYGPYSQRIRAEFEAPQQAMYFVDKTRGKCMVTALWVGEDT